MGITLSAMSNVGLLFLVVIFGVALIGFVVDMIAKKHKKSIKVGYEYSTSKKDEVKAEEVTDQPQEVVADEPAIEPVVEEPVAEETPVVEETVSEQVIEEVPVEETPVVIEQESVADTGKGFDSKAYSRSYMSKLIQADPTTQARYSQIKNELLSYGKMRASVAWTNETFRTGNDTVARIMLRGKTVLLLLALDPQEFATTKYAGEDISDVKRYANTPMRLRVTSDRRLKYALELIALLVSRKEYAKNSYTPVEYAYDYQTDEQLIESGLIKAE